MATIFWRADALGLVRTVGDACEDGAVGKRQKVMHVLQHHLICGVKLQLFVVKRRDENVFAFLVAQRAQCRAAGRFPMEIAPVVVNYGFAQTALRLGSRRLGGTTCAVIFPLAPGFRQNSAV